MKRRDSTEADGVTRRQLAERKLKERQLAGDSGLSEAEGRELLHELQVYQIELEMQNEELRRAQAEADAASARYRDLFTFAPVGYFHLGEGGVIREVNLAGAALVRLDRSQVISQRFEAFVASSDRSSFSAFCRAVISSDARQTCEVTLAVGSPTRLQVELEGVASSDGLEGEKTLRLTVVDVTERRQLEDVQSFLLRRRDPHHGEDFFRALARYLAQSLGLDFVCIDRLLGDGLTARTLAVYSDGEFEDNLDYGLKDTPCGSAVGETLCCYPQGVCRLFPRDEFLCRLKAEGYVGATLWSWDGKPIGLIAMISRAPLRDYRLTELTLRLVAGHAAGELEHREAEKALVKSEERGRSYLEVTGQLGWNTNPDGEVVEDLPSWRKFTGQSVKEVLGWGWSKALHPDDLARTSAIWQAAVQDREAYETEYRIRRHDGVYRNFLARGVPVFDQVGSVREWVGTCIDVTERNRNEMEVRQSREDLDHAQEVGQIGSWRLDVRRNVLTWSAENYRIFGLTKGSPLTYETFLGIVHPEDREYVDTQWKAGLAGKPYDIEHRILVAGETRWVRETANLEFSPDGNLLGGFGITQDISSRKGIEERLKASVQEKEVLLKEIHHRVKNNLQVVASLVSLKLDAVADPALQTVLRGIRDRVRTMALVHETLYDAGDLARLDFGEYAGRVLNYLWSAHGEAASKIRLTLSIPPLELPVEMAVPCGLILNELAGNALKHGFPNRSEGEVRVSLERQPDTSRIQLNVCDNGVGLPAGGDWRESDSLGLKLVQMLTQQIHGSLVVGSGPGAEFQIVFDLPNAQ